LSHKRFPLVIDASFAGRDLELFPRAEWDGVFYYDKLDEVVPAIHA